MTDFQSAVLASLKAMVPALLALVLATLTKLPLGDGTGGVPMPHLTLMLVYYWSIHRPELLPMPVVVGIGLYQDLIWGGPPGLNMLVLLIAQVILSNQQSLFTRRDFIVGWMGFVPVTVLAMGLSWIVASLYYGVIAPGYPLLTHGLTTLAAYPLLGWLFGRVDRVLKRN